MIPGDGSGVRRETGKAQGHGAKFIGCVGAELDVEAASAIFG
jgi:hypothetical protein